MSIFGNIKNAIFGHPAAAATGSSTPAATLSSSAPSTPEPAATTAAPVGGKSQAVPPTAGAAPAPAQSVTLHDHSRSKSHLSWTRQYREADRSSSGNIRSWT